MALIEYDVYKQKLRDLGPELEKISAALDIDAARQEAERLEAETAMDGFWNNLERSPSRAVTRGHGNLDRRPLSLHPPPPPQPARVALLAPLTCP